MVLHLGYASYAKTATAHTTEEEAHMGIAMLKIGLVISSARPHLNLVTLNLHVHVYMYRHVFSDPHQIHVHPG